LSTCRGISSDSSSVELCLPSNLADLFFDAFSVLRCFNGARFFMINDLRSCDIVMVAAVFKFDLAIVFLVAVLADICTLSDSFSASLASFAFLVLSASLLWSPNLKTPVA
jgi:hypothetical protein